MDAIFLARRFIEDTNISKDRSLIMLALDWAKAFDCISPAGLILSLSRFGIPDKFLKVVQSIYTNRCVFKYLTLELHQNCTLRNLVFVRAVRCHHFYLACS
ncbi:unnamed protein product [Polarella glacialis]|uniref:Reverse transcriptase domain-containing protein n=1 Tax=Polarella glacialis TaxID=89957 RepID=A0A813GIN4_POLGL|nr:unnamed protein product [Polarella glacialis]